MVDVFLALSPSSIVSQRPQPSPGVDPPAAPKEWERVSKIDGFTVPEFTYRAIQDYEARRSR